MSGPAPVWEFWELEVERSLGVAALRRWDFSRSRSRSRYGRTTQASETATVVTIASATATRLAEPAPNTRR
jgi:hypothetical protein